MKMFRFRKMAIIGALGISGGAGFAQDASPQVVIPPTPNVIEHGESVESLLTIERATEIALANHASIHEVSAEVEHFRGTRWNDTRKPNPQLGYVASQIGDQGNAGQQGFYYSQEFVTANKLGLNSQVGGWEIETAKWKTEVQRLRVKGDVQQRFYDVLAARRQVEILTTMDAVLQDGVAVAERLLDKGEVSRGDLLQAQQRQKSNQLQLQNAKIQAETSVQLLAVVMGLDHLGSLRIAGSITASPPELEDSAGMESTIATHPLLEAARAEMVRHQWAVQRARVEPIPNVQTQWGAQYDNTTHDTVVNIQVGFNLPKNNRNLGNISAASADYIQASHKVKRLELALQNEYLKAFQNYSIAKQTLHQTETELLPIAQETLTTAQKLYQLGEMSYVGLLNAQQSYVTTLLELNSAQLNAWQAVAMIENGLLTGGLSLDP